MRPVARLWRYRRNVRRQLSPGRSVQPGTSRIMCVRHADEHKYQHDDKYDRLDDHQYRDRKHVDRGVDDQHEQFDDGHREYLDDRDIDNDNSADDNDHCCLDDAAFDHYKHHRALHDPTLRG